MLRAAEALGLVLFCAARLTVAEDALATAPLISQKGRAFHPGEVAIRADDEVRVFNDDGPRLHHVFVEAPDLRFDSDEIEPGQVVTIRLPRAGRYPVLCRIHPRRRLEVTVRRPACRAGARLAACRAHDRPVRPLPRRREVL
jgi:plastocyanin